MTHNLQATINFKKKVNKNEQKSEGPLYVDKSVEKKTPVYIMNDLNQI